MMASKNDAIEPGVWLNSVIWPFRFVYQLILTVVTAWLMALALAYVFDQWIWEQGTARVHLKQALMLVLNDALVLGIQDSSASEFVLTCASTAYEWVFVSTGVETLLARASAGLPPNGMLEGIVFNLASTYRSEVDLAMASTQLFGAKVGLLITALPLLVVVYMVGTVDGLVARYIRTQGGGQGVQLLVSPIQIRGDHIDWHQRDCHRFAAHGVSAAPHPACLRCADHDFGQHPMALL